MHVIVVDDASTDATASIVRDRAAGDPRVELGSAGPLPQGWLGKSNACLSGSRRQSAADAEWLCFVDADVDLGPGALRAAVARAEADGLDMLCLAPRQELDSFAARLVIPCGLYIIAFDGAPRRGLKNPLEAPATGQFMLVRRTAYESVGGHAAVADEIAEDLKLARLFIRAGFRVRTFDGAGLASVRMYGDWRHLWQGFSKNVVDLFGGPKRTAALASVALLLAVLSVAVPVGLAPLAVAHPYAFAVALAATVAALGFHVAGALHLRIPFWYGLIFPLGYLAGAAIAFDSVRRRRNGKVSWKGRVCT